MNNTNFNFFNRRSNCCRRGYSRSGTKDVSTQMKFYIKFEQLNIARCVQLNNVIKNMWGRNICTRIYNE